MSAGVKRPDEAHSLPWLDGGGLPTVQADIQNQAEPELYVYLGEGELDDLRAYYKEARRARKGNAQAGRLPDEPCVIISAKLSEVLADLVDTVINDGYSQPGDREVVLRWAGWLRDAASRLEAAATTPTPKQNQEVP